MTSANHLLRDHAPIPDRAWKAIDEEAKERLTPLLAARRLVDWVGPGGWRHDALSLGRTDPLDTPPAGLDGARSAPTAAPRAAARRVPRAVHASRAPRSTTSSAAAATPSSTTSPGRPGSPPSWRTGPCSAAGQRAGIDGMTDASPYPPDVLGDDCSSYPGLVAVAVDRLRQNGIEGPYALAIDPERYTAIVSTTEHGGYPLMEHLGRVLESGSVVALARPRPGRSW